MDWNSRKSSCDKHIEIAVSSSKGDISKFKLNENGLEKSWNRTDCHEYEAWITVFDAWNSNTVFSGGDDGLLKMHDTRSETR